MLGQAGRTDPPLRRISQGRRGVVRDRRSPVPYFGDHLRANVVGAVCPQTGQCFTMIFDTVDTDAFQLHLHHLAHAVPLDPSTRRLLNVDNASRHKAVRSNGHHFEPNFLPAYSPDFSPIEGLWLRLKADCLPTSWPRPHKPCTNG